MKIPEVEPGKRVVQTICHLGSRDRWVPSQLDLRISYSLARATPALSQDIRVEEMLLCGRKKLVFSFKPLGRITCLESTSRLDHGCLGEKITGLLLCCALRARKKILNKIT